MGDSLTPKQARFVSEYLVDGNATRAAIAAGYSERSAAVSGSKLLKDPRIEPLIRERQKRTAEKLEITAERTLQELAKIAYHDPGAFFDENDNLVAISKLGPNERASLEGFEVLDKPLGEGKRFLLTKIKKADRIRALEILGKHQRLFGDSSFSAEVDTGPGGLGPDSAIKIVLVRPA